MTRWQLEATAVKVTVGKIITKRTKTPERDPKPVPPAETTRKWNRPLEGQWIHKHRRNPHSRANRWLQETSSLGETSVMKCCTNGKRCCCKRAESKVTIKEPRIIGRAPNSLQQDSKSSQQKTKDIDFYWQRKSIKPFGPRKSKSWQRPRQSNSCIEK